MNTTWTCPTCKRLFKKEKQTHSCKLFPVEHHFKNRSDEIKSLYDELLERIEKEVGDYHIEAVSCCIHLDKGAFTFLAVYQMKDKVRMHISFDHEVDHPRIVASSQISKTLYKHRVEIKEENEIDKELISWIKEAYTLKD